MKEQYVNKADISALSGLSRFIVNRLVREGDLPPARVCRKYFRRDEVVAAFAKMGVPFADADPRILRLMRA